MPTWSLADADDITSRHRYTFYKPPPETIRKVVVGEVVKLIFRFESDDPEAPAAERMWVVVDEIDEQGLFKGRLGNEPRYISDLAPGNVVHFRACHIVNTEHDDENNLVERYLPRCFVTRRVLDDGERVGYLYREAPDEDEDSGWRIMAGDESDEYMDDVRNVAYVSLGAVLNRDDSFLGLLDSAVGSAFVRDPVADRFVAGG